MAAPANGCLRLPHRRQLPPRVRSVANLGARPLSQPLTVLRGMPVSLEISYLLCLAESSLTRSISSGDLTSEPFEAIRRVGFEPTRPFGQNLLRIPSLPIP